MLEEKYNAIYRSTKETAKMLEKLCKKFDRDASWVIRFLVKQEYEKDLPEKKRK